jgi:pyrophosphatase PpaX
MLQGISAVLFDIDGTLLDTFDFIYGAYEHAFRVHGIPPLSHDEIAHLMGGPLTEVYAMMAPGLDANALAETHRQFQENNLHLAKLFPDTVKVLSALAEQGFKLAAITTRSIRTSVLSLEQNGIAGYFDLVLSAEDVTRHKPDPEPLFKALDTLNIEAVNAVMVGDTAADIMAGKNAGTATVAALYGFGADRLRALQPDYAIRELKELLEIVGT